MATGRTYTIEDFHGINESPDGDTGLRMGEAADMLNFRITAERNLQIRPGYAAVCTISEGHPVRGMWCGYVGAAEHWLVACNGHIYEVDRDRFTVSDLGTLTDAPTYFFGFSGKVYMLNGTEYKVWDGTALSDVAGYAPIIRHTAAPATGSGAELEQVNKLTGSKWVWYSSATGSTEFKLPEGNVDSIEKVLLNDTEVTSGITKDLVSGKVTFSSAPGEGTDNVKIKYTKGTGDRTAILSQKFAESYNGYTDNRVFLYGDGTNKAYYSGLEYQTGKPTAEYFPDLNVLDVGASNTPLTALVRHFDKLMAYKTDSTWLIYYDSLTLSGGTVTPGFYTRAIDRDTGNAAPGQVRLANNFPISLHGNSVYRWGLVYSSGVQDERAAQRISDRVRETLRGFDLSKVLVFDDEFEKELWILQGGKACVYQYAGEAQGNSSYKNNVWYVYSGVPATAFLRVRDELYFSTTDGKIMHMSRTHHSDNGAAISAYWETGSMPFDAMEARKYIRLIFVGMKPESGGRITLTAQTDNRSDYEEKLVSCSLATFSHADFAHWSFNTNRKPKTRRVKLKAKKFTHFKLIFKSNSASATATITALTIPVEYGSYAK